MEELEIMRQQLSAMKRQLDTQQIVNKELLRKVMRGKASWLNKFVNIEIIMLPFLILIILAASSLFGISGRYALIYTVLCVIDVAIDWRVMRIPSKMFGTASILDLKKLLLRQKKERFIQTCVMLPISIIWAIAFSYAIFVNTNEPLTTDNSVAKICGVVSGIIGGIVGAIVIVVIYRKMQQTNDALLRDIHDFENEA